MVTVTSIVCVLHQAVIETTVHVPAPPEVMVDVVIAPLVGVIVQSMESMAVMAAEVRGDKGEVEASIANEAPRTATVGVIVRVAMNKPCLPQVRSALNMIVLCRLTTLRVGRMHPLPPNTRTLLTTNSVLSRTLFVGGVT